MNINILKQEIKKKLLNKEHKLACFPDNKYKNKNEIYQNIFSNCNKKIGLHIWSIEAKGKILKLKLIDDKFILQSFYNYIILNISSKNIHKLYYILNKNEPTQVFSTCYHSTLLAYFLNIEKSNKLEDPKEISKFKNEYKNMIIFEY